MFSLFYKSIMQEVPSGCKPGDCICSFKKRYIG